jgi:hypothetical protein
MAYRVTTAQEKPLPGTHRGPSAHDRPDEAGSRVAQDTPAQSPWSAIRQMWSDPQRWIGVLLAAAPSLVFVAVNAVWSLYPAIIAAAVTAVTGLGYRLVRRQPVTSALVGIGVVVVCAVAAAITGQARGFFLVPLLIPFAVILICLATIVVRRPLTGLILNRVTGGPADWYRHRGLLKVHLIATGTAVVINVINATVQVIFYGRGDTLILAVAHTATGPIFATLVAVTIVAVRRTLARRQ